MADDTGTFGSAFGGQDATTPANAEPTQGQGLFGSGFALPMQPAPTADPLDIAQSTLTQRVQRAQAATTGAGGAMLGLFDPEARQHNLQLIQQGTEQLQQIQQQRATKEANQREAATLGIAPGTVSDLAPQSERLQIAKDRAMRGDAAANRGLAIVDPKAASDVQQMRANQQQARLLGLDGMSDLATRDQRVEAARARALAGDDIALRGLMAVDPEAARDIASQRANHAESLRLGLPGNEVPDTATREVRVEAAKARALQGNLKVFQSLQIVDPKAAESIQDKVHEVMGSHLENAQTAYDKLANASNQGEYNATLNQLRKEGTLTDIEALGVKVPNSIGEFSKTKALDGASLREARIGLDGIKQKLEARNTYQPLEKKEAETYGSRITTVSGLPVDNGTWSRNASTNTPGIVINGMDDPRNLGKTFSLVKRETMKPVVDQFEVAVPKADLEKYRNEMRTYQLATKGAPPGEINSNPNVQQAISESLASLLRGGSGGATLGLVKMEGAGKGYIQGILDKIHTEKAGLTNELKGKDVEPYLTKLTQAQKRDVLDTLKNYNDKDIADRVGPIAEAAGAAGYDPTVFGLSKGETAGAIGDAMERGRQAQIARMTPSHQAIGGGDGVLQVGAQRPGAGATNLPAGAAPANQLPGAQPLQTPVQQANNPPAPPAPAGPQPEGSKPGAAGGAPPVQPPNGGDPLGRWSGSGPTSPTQPQPPVQPTGDDGPPRPHPHQPGWLRGGAPPVQPLDDAGARPPDPDPVHHAMNGVANLVDSTVAATGGTPAQAVAMTKKLASNPRIESELEKTGQVSGKTVAAALGKGGDKTFVAKATEFLNKWFMQGIPEDDEPSPKPRPYSPSALAAAGATQDPRTGLLSPRAQAAADVGNSAVEHAPVIGGILGAAAGPFGAVAGGAGGQSLKDYMQGNAQDPVEIVKQGALSGVLSVASAARPVLATAARVAGTGLVNAGATAAQGGDAADATLSGLQGSAAAVGGEAFGRALGMVGHKLFSLFAPKAQAGIQEAAETLVSARKVLETTEPKIAGAKGAIDNPAYTKAEMDVTKAETTLKDAGIKPEEAEYAYKVTQDGVPKQEALVNRPGALEKTDIGAGYQKLEGELPPRKGLAAANAEASAAQVPGARLKDGPVDAVKAGAVSAKHEELAQRTEAAITQPAKNWQEKWSHLKDARTTLLEAERDALTSTAPGRTRTAEDMRALADTVRVQQAKIAKAVFGVKKGQDYIDRLSLLDTRYRRLIEATNGGDMAAAARLKGEDGREADKRFRAFAQGDRDAIDAWDAMRNPKNHDVENKVLKTIQLEKVPYLGTVYSVGKFMREWTIAKAAGDPVKFSDLVRTHRPDSRPTRDLVGTVAQRAAVMGQ